LPPKMRKNGIAIDVNGVKLFEIHGSIRSGRRRGRKQKVDWDGVIKPPVVAYLRSKERNSRTRGLQAKVEKFIFKLLEDVDITVSETVVREHARRFLSEYLNQDL
jgi:hypothetical protein